MWFVFALICMLAWGAADLFYKKGADPEEKHSHLWTSVAVGFVMGLHALYLLLTLEGSYDPRNLIIYLPVSAMYILSMTVGYFGLRYLQLSISSPIQNSSGAVTCILCLVLLGQAMDAISAVGVVLICAGIFLLGLIEYKKDKEENPLTEENKKYSIGFVAFLMPIIYCILDALGTFFDAYYLDDVEATPLVGVTEANFESVANISYEFTFLIVGIVLLLYLTLIKKERLVLKKQGNRLTAAVLETAGQAAYVYAMSGQGVVAAPMIASYSIVSLILSRIFLKEKLTKKQYIMVAVVMIGIALLGLAEGLAEE